MSSAKVAVRGDQPGSCLELGCRSDLTTKVNLEPLRYCLQFRHRLKFLVPRVAATTGSLLFEQSFALRISMELPILKQEAVSRFAGFSESIIVEATMHPAKLVAKCRLDFVVAGGCLAIGLGKHIRAAILARLVRR